MNNAPALNNPLSQDNSQLLENLTLLLKCLAVVDKCDHCKAKVLEIEREISKLE